MTNSASFILFVVLVLKTSGATPGKQPLLMINKLEMCSLQTDYPIKCYANIRTVDNRQYFDTNCTLPVPFGDKIDVEIWVDMYRHNRKFHLADVRKRNACKALNVYGGELARDIERTMEMVPGVCPIEVGTHRLTNYELDFKKLTNVPLEIVPSGNIQGKVKLIEHGSNRLLFCVDADIDRLD